MFTGIVQAVATLTAIEDRPGLRTLTLAFPPGFAVDLAIGASVAVDGVCLTVTGLLGADAAEFDVMQQTLALSTLASFGVGSKVNVERAAKEGAEIGGHPLSGHIDFTAELVAVRQPENNHVLRIAIAPEWLRYVFAKGYIAINGASLTVAEVDRDAGWIELWLIPETLRATTFGDKVPGAKLNIEIERETQVLVDSVRGAVAETLGPLVPLLEAIVREQGDTLDGLLAAIAARSRA
ncbi:riboflavin synthase subunit alpha [Chitinolyticbacter albus]|uniref:riboflavin synthase subunit alpha n=1 Tax=Chitinolyticbacter albus TaxID=2961951 RepID=UPI00210CA229|nr:riboflavin synthase subunit alpha [Chitinolyticbacter albus]